MDSEAKFSNINSTDLFAEALERIDAGEPLDIILTSYPAQLHDELRQLLTIVGMAQDIRNIPVTDVSPVRRRKGKQAFLKAAAARRAEINVASTPQTISNPAVKQREPQAQPSASPGDLLQRLWQNFQNLLKPRTLQLAPIALVLVVLLLSTSSLITAAQSAVPGDLTYGVKQWIRQQELNLAPVEQRELVLKEQEKELAEDIQVAIEKNDLGDIVIQEDATLVFYGYAGQRLRVGPLFVLPQYQANPNSPDVTPIDLPADLQPGSQVTLRYQTQPGMSSNDGPLQVQGIQIQVVATPIPTPIPTRTATPAPPPTSTPCVRIAPAGWVSYQVRTGDTLSAIAARGATSVQQLIRVNCLPSDLIQSGSSIYAPGSAIPAPPLTATNTPLPTKTATATEPSLPVSTVNPLVTLIPTETPTRDVTVPATEIATLVANTETPVALTGTPIKTVIPTGIPVTSVPAVTPTAGSPTATPEGGVPPTETAEATATTEAGPTDVLTVEVPTIEVPVGTATPTPVAQETAVVEPTPTPAVIDSSSPTAIPTGDTPPEATPTTVLPTTVPIEPTETPVVLGVSPTEVPEATDIPDVSPTEEVPSVVVTIEAVATSISSGTEPATGDAPVSQPEPTAIIPPTVAPTAVPPDDIQNDSTQDDSGADTETSSTTTTSTSNGTTTSTSATTVSTGSSNGVSVESTNSETTIAVEPAPKQPEVFVTTEVLITSAVATAEAIAPAPTIAIPTLAVPTPVIPTATPVPVVETAPEAATDEP